MSNWCDMSGRQAKLSEKHADIVRECKRIASMPTSLGGAREDELVGNDARKESSLAALVRHNFLEVMYVEGHRHFCKQLPNEFHPGGTVSSFRLYRIGWAGAQFLVSEVLSQEKLPLAVRAAKKLAGINPTVLKAARRSPESELYLAIASILSSERL